jgi:hypothetical protein
VSEADELRVAQSLVASGKTERALPILWKLFASNDLDIKVYAGLALLVSLDRMSQTDELLELTDSIVAAASALGRREVHAYLLSKKAMFLSDKVGILAFQQRSLNLAARAFEWIDFSLEDDKAEFMRIAAERIILEKEITSLENEVLIATESSHDHYMRGHIFTSLGEIHFSRFLTDQLDLSNGGRLHSRIMNLYFVRRWNLDKVVGYSRESRRKLKNSKNQLVACFRKATEEFELGGYKSDLAQALYALAVKFTITYGFAKAKRYLNRAKRLAQAENETTLFAPILDLEKEIKDKHRHPRNFVEEFGMNLPRGFARRGSSNARSS